MSNSINRETLINHVIQLRQDLSVQVWLPLDLTIKEATRLATWIHLLVIPEDPAPAHQADCKLAFCEGHIVPTIPPMDPPLYNCPKDQCPHAVRPLAAP